MSAPAKRKRRPISPTLVLLIITSVAYAISLGGLARALGGWVGWAVVVVGAALPAGYLLVKSAEDRSIERDRAELAGETYQPPADDSAPEPLPRPQPVPYD